MNAYSEHELKKRIEYHILRQKSIHMYVDMFQPVVKSLGATDGGDAREYVDIVIALDSADSFIAAAITFRELIRQKRIENVKIEQPRVSMPSLVVCPLPQLLSLANELGLHITNP